MLRELHPKGKGLTRGEVLAQKWIGRATRDEKPLENLLDRTEGKVTQVVESTSTNIEIDATDTELDGWIRSQGYVKATDCPTIPCGLRGVNVEGPVDAGEASGSPESETT